MIMRHRDILYTRIHTSLTLRQLYSYTHYPSVRALGSNFHEVLCKLISHVLYTHTQTENYSPSESINSNHEAL